jgi:hypothetical protein
MAERTHRRLALGRPDPAVATALVALVVAEAAVLGAYLFLARPTLSTPRYLLYPFVWIDVGVLAVLAAYPPGRGVGERTRLLAAVVAVAYVLLLARLAGLLVLLPAGGGHVAFHGLQVTTSAPGWGPRVAYAGDLLRVSLVPFRVVGYLALGVLLYGAVVDASRAAAGGVLGVAACVGCALPAALPVLTAVTGGTLGLASVLPAVSLDVSTAAFVTTAVLLAWRPTQSIE